MERFDWTLLVRHNHPMTIGFGKTQISICARCTGTMLGFFSLMVLAQIANLSAFINLGLTQQLLICFLLITPLCFDWLTQTLGLRGSTNFIRSGTGLLEGLSVALLSMAAATIEFKFAIVSGVGAAIVMVGLLARRYVNRRLGS